MIKTLECIEEAIVTVRKKIMEILNLKSEFVLNGESVRGVELVKILQGQEIPLHNEDVIVVFYVNDTEDINVVQGDETCQSFDFHVIIYGNRCRKFSSKLRTNLYSEYIRSELGENGVELLNVSTPENTSEFIGNATYVLRSDLDILLNCVIKNKEVKEINSIEELNVSYEIN